MPWRVIGSETFWYPENIDPGQKKMLSLVWFWPYLWVAGVEEDDKVIAYLQKIRQPFQLLDISMAVDEYAYDYRTGESKTLPE